MYNTKLPAGPALSARVKIRKYATTSLIAEKLVPCKNLSQAALISAAFAHPTWKKHEAAVNSLKYYELANNIELSWPLSTSSLSGYVTWALTQKNLKTSTVVSYLSSLKSIHGLRSLSTENFDSPILSTLIRGGENLEIYEIAAKGTRKVMTLPLLKIIGHEIASSDWSPFSKQIFWTACTTAFFGSFRLGELLPSTSKNSHPEDTLLWKDVKFISKDHVLIHVKVSKTRSKQGDFVDIFSFPGHGVCPVKSLLSLKKQAVNVGPDCPVFCFDTGINLTLCNLNKTLRELLQSQLGDDSRLFSGHSFRAAIPAVLAKYPEVSNSDEIMGWGRWKSSAYLTYTRLKADQRKKIFGKITAMLNSSSSFV